MFNRNAQNTFNNVKNPFDVNRVILSAVDDTIQQDTNLEPPFVRDRWASTGNLYIDTKNAARISNFTWAINTAQFQLNYQKVTRLSLQFVSIPWCINNINRRNNTILFRVGVTNYTASISINNYLTLTSLANAIQAALNLAGSPITFTVGGIDNGCLNISATGLFRFLDSPAIRRGTPCHGLAPFEFPTNNFTGGLAILMATRYIDISCPEILTYTKMPNASEKFGNNVISRITLFQTPGRQINVVYSAPLNVINWDRNAPISALTFSILDEFGEEPPLDDQDPTPITPTFSFICQT